jgi:gas vesicle protein
MNLTDEDKRWILEQLQGMEKRLKQELIEELTQSLRATEKRLKEELTESLRDMQTEILRAIEPWQHQNQARDAALEARSAAVESRMDIMERRLVQIEKKLLLEPPERS